MKKNKNLYLFILLFLLVTILFALFYISIRIFLFIFIHYRWTSKIFASVLLLAQIFFIFQGFGYLFNALHILIKKKTLFKEKREKYQLSTFPPVVIAIPSLLEPLGVLEQTLISCYNLTYPNKHIYLLDDTYCYEIEKEQKYLDDVEALCKKFKVNLFRRNMWRGAKAGILNDFLSYLDGKREGLECKIFEKNPLEEEFEYLAIFDADQNPFTDFLEPLVYKMQKDARLAFVQTPQYYTNFEISSVAAAASILQAVFFEYICEGKSEKNAVFFCGTNVLLRREALKDVGGFDESSVTEDFATSFSLHLKGWKSTYYTKINTFGMAPEDLGSYFAQQFRWAFGNIGLSKRLFKEMFFHPTKLTISQWWEYFLSSTYYLTGIVFLIFFSMPLIYLFFGAPVYFADIRTYFIIFIPYFFFSLVSFFWTMKKRGYESKNLFLGYFLIVVSFPVYIKAAVMTFLNKKVSFVKTRKKREKVLTIYKILPQLVMAALCFVGIIWGANKVIYEKGSLGAFLINIFWCLYNFLILSTILYFNRPEEEKYFF